MVTHMRWRARSLVLDRPSSAKNVDRAFWSTGPGRRGSVAFYPLNTQHVKAQRMGASTTHRFIWTTSSGKRSIVSSDIAYLQRKKGRRRGCYLKTPQARFVRGIFSGCPISRRLPRAETSEKMIIVRGMSRVELNQPLTFNNAMEEQRGIIYRRHLVVK